MNDINTILSSRVRLARNIEKINMPGKISYADSEKVENQIKKALNKEDFKLKFYSLKELSKLDIDVLTEKRVISKELSNKANISSFLVSDNEEITVMINEEDHIRIQTIKQGFDLWEAWSEAAKIDDALDDKINYAYDEQFGYLTACPTNTGTGLRASIMVHLPFLTSDGSIANIINSVRGIGVEIRGYSGEGSKAYGAIYQISNQIKLGKTEEDIIRQIESIVSFIVNKETLARTKTYEQKKYQVEDQVYRSLAILKNARLLGFKESMDLLSNLRVGIYLDLLNIEKTTLDSLTMNTQNANIVREMDNINIDEINKKRAELFRETLK